MIEEEASGRGDDEAGTWRGAGEFDLKKFFQE